MCSVEAAGLEQQPEGSVADRTREVLDFIHGLLLNINGQTAAPAEVLHDLARLFRTGGAGAVALLHQNLAWKVRKQFGTAAEPKCRWPWEECPDLLFRDWQGREIQEITIAAGVSLLLARVQQSPETAWVIWLEAGGPRSWTAREKAGMALAATALARVLRPTLDRAGWDGTVETKRWQQRLEQAALVAGPMSHDFGNILTGVLGFADLALSQITPASAPYRLVKEIHQAAQQGARIVQRLSLVRRRRPRPPQASQFLDVLNQELDRIRKACPAEVLLDQEPAEGVPAVALEAEALRQVLAQLLDNAREAIRGPGKICLAARTVLLQDSECLSYLGNLTSGNYLEVTITDTGSGISPDVRQRLATEIFVTTKSGHWGQGLSMVFGLLSISRGGFRLEEGPGGGTTVRLMLPLAAKDNLQTKLAPNSVLNKEKVLVVDDDPVILDMVCTILNREGYRVQPAASGPEAIDSFFAAGTDPFRMVLSDVIMPAMNGFDLVRTLRSHDPSVKVMFLTGQGTAGGAEGDLAPQHVNILSKPFRPDGLLQAVRATLDCGVTPCP
jgi:signal transduction histidine kinase/CheY-like chemotaxis protein